MCRSRRPRLTDGREPQSTPAHPALRKHRGARGWRLHEHPVRLLNTKEDATITAHQYISPQYGSMQRRVLKFKQKPLLWVHIPGLRLSDSERGRVKALRTCNEASVACTSSLHLSKWSVRVTIKVPPCSRNDADRIATRKV